MVCEAYSRIGSNRLVEQPNRWQQKVKTRVSFATVFTQCTDKLQDLDKAFILVEGLSHLYRDEPILPAK